MANINKWTTPSAWVTCAATQLNSLANAAVTVGTTIDTETSLEMNIDFSLRLGSINPTSNPFVNLYLLPTSDNGNSADRTASQLFTFIVLTTGSSAKINGACGFVISPGKYLPAVENQSGVTFAASGNSLTYRTYSTQNNA